MACVKVPHPSAQEAPETVQEVIHTESALSAILKPAGSDRRKDIVLRSVGRRAQGQIQREKGGSRQ